MAFVQVGENMQSRLLSDGNDCETLSTNIVAELLIIHDSAKEVLQAEDCDPMHVPIACMALFTSSRHLRVDLGSVPGGGHGWIEMFPFTEDEHKNIKDILERNFTKSEMFSEKALECDWYDRAASLVNIKSRHVIEATSPSATAYNAFISFKNIGVQQSIISSALDGESNCQKVHAQWNCSICNIFSQSHYKTDTCTPVST